MSSHSWHFFVSGGVNQVVLATGDDLRNLASLDQKLWVALSCPTNVNDIDVRTMALIDADGDQRVRASDILLAVEFVCSTLRDPGEIFQGAKSLPLASLRDDSALGKTLLSSARSVLASKGKSGAAHITLEDVSDVGAIFTAMSLNGDGIVHPGATSDPALVALIGEIVQTMGGEKDRSGADGASAPKVEAFYAACAEFAAWNTRATAEAATLLPLEAGTGAAAGALAAIAGKIEDYFARCRLAAFDDRAVAALNRAETEYVTMAPQELTAACAPLESFPLANVGAGRPLPVEVGVNPAWAARMAALRATVVVPVLGERSVLTEADWERLKAALAPYTAWQGAPGGAAVAALGAERIGQILAGDGKAGLLALIAADEARRADAESIGQVERLVRFYAQLGRLLHNFVNFGAFYGRKEKAIFQIGTVYFDQRSCDLVLRVEDAGRHASMAALAGTYLVYFDCTRRADGRHLTACAAVTDGDSDDIMVGRNGVFYDREGRDYDARITKIVDNPISIRQAFWAPYKKFLRTVEEMVAKRAADADAAATAKVNAAAAATANADQAVLAAGAAPAPAPAPAASKPIDIGTVAALGVAVGGISAVLGALLETFFGLGMWMPLGVLGLVMLISGPSMLIAALKLRRRSLGPILDADGWAVNAQARINIPFGASLTSLATLPPGSSRDLRDPYAQKKSAWPYVIAFLLIVAAAAFTWYAVTQNGAAVAPVVPVEAAAPPA